jgi:hypothetical protein
VQPVTDPLAGRRFWLALVAVLAVAAALRLAGLGTWPFASDELGSFNDVALFNDPPPQITHPDQAVPPVIPVAMAALDLGHRVFGRDEFGCRVVVAAFGVLHIAAVVIGLSLVLPRTVALTCGVWLAVAVEHIFYCQYHRFYTLAALWVGCATLCAARSAKVSSAGWMAAACGFGFLAVLTHTVTGAVFGILLAGGVIAAFGGSKRPLAVAAGGSAVALGWLVAVVLPALRAKTAMTSWLGLSPAHAALGVVAQASWPVCALAAAGLVVLWHRDRAQALFWAFAGVVWVGAAVALPKVLVFHTAYTFPLMLPAFVFAAVAAEACASAVPGRAGAWAVRLALPLLNLPSLASYYQDGNRHDFRAAAAYVVEHIQPNDRVLSNEPDKLLYYRPELRPKVAQQLRGVPPAEALAQVPLGGRLWVVCGGGRGGFEPAWQAWVYAHCHQQTRIERPRYDYYAFPVWVFRTAPR